MKSLIIFTFIIFSLLATGVLAQDFSIQTEISNEYFSEKTGLIFLTIGNPYQTDNFEVSVVGFPKWIEPESPNIQIGGGENRLVLIFVRPSKDASPGVYKYVLKVTRSSTDSSIEKEIPINVFQPKDVIVKDFALSCYSCIDKVVVKGKIENIGTETKNLSYQVKYSVFTKEKNIGLLSPGGFEEFSEEFDLRTAIPNLYNIQIRIWKDSQEVVYADNKLFILSTERTVSYDKETTSLGPFGNFITITAINNGNLPDEARMIADVNTEWYSVFNGPNPSGNILGKFIWTELLLPGYSASVSYSEIFWPTYIFLFLLITGGIVGYWKVIALTVNKVSSRRRMSRGDEVSVSLHMRNRSREIDNVIVKDIIPEGFSVTSSFSTVKPVIRKVVEGIELVWRIGKLKKHEERVLHYKIKSIKDFAGRVHLPSAHVKAEYEDGKQLMRKSNRLLMHSHPAPVSLISVKVE